MKDTMDTLIDEFNETVGRNEGIIINVTSITGSATIHEKLKKMCIRDSKTGALSLKASLYFMVM